VLYLGILWMSRAVAPRRLTLRCPGPRPAPCCCRPPAHRAIVLRRSRPCSPAPPPLLPQAAASRVASLRLACPPLRPCPEARLCAPHRSSPRAWYLTEIDWERIPVRPSAPPRHPAPASMSVGRRRAREFPPGQSPSPLVGSVSRPTHGFSGTALLFCFCFFLKKFEGMMLFECVQ
jgi:hypothetical protein